MSFEASQLLQEFFKEARASLDLLRQDCAQMSIILHRLKGSAMMIDCFHLAQLWHQCENALEKKDFLELHKLFSKCQSEINFLEKNKSLSLRIKIQNQFLGSESFQLSHLFLECEKLAQKCALDSGKKIIFRYPDTKIKLKTQDFGRLRETLAVLITNAILHGIESPESRLQKGKSEYGEIKIEAHVESDQVVLKFCDDGKGFDHISKKEITFYSGRGVGLVSAKQNLEAMNGEFAIDTSQNEGPTFILKWAA